MFVWTFVSVYIYLEQFLLCWLAYVAHIGGFSTYSVGGSPTTLKKPRVWKLRVKEQFFNIRQQVRCVNAYYGFECFRMYLDGSYVLDPAQFPAPSITLSPLWQCKPFPDSNCVTASNIIVDLCVHVWMHVSPSMSTCT